MLCLVHVKVYHVWYMCHYQCHILCCTFRVTFASLEITVLQGIKLIWYIIQYLLVSCQSIHNIFYIINQTWYQSLANTFRWNRHVLHRSYTIFDRSYPFIIYISCSSNLLWCKSVWHGCQSALYKLSGLNSSTFTHTIYTGCYLCALLIKWRLDNFSSPPQS